MCYNFCHVLRKIRKRKWLFANNFSKTSTQELDLRISQNRLLAEDSIV